MWFVRILLIFVITLSAPLSGAMEAGHASAPHSDHAAMDMMMADAPSCCEESSDRTSSCHILIALCPSATQPSPIRPTGEALFASVDLLLKGVKPSGLLDPPRAV